MIKKYFALSIVAASLTLAGCSSDDDDDNGETDGTVDSGMTDGGTDGETDGETDGGVPPVEDMSTNTGNSVLDLARGTDADGDGEIDPDSGVADISELTAALANYPDLVNALDDEDTAYTVFAPNNDAFPDGAEADDALKNTLSYHVATGQAFNTLAVEAGTTFPLSLTTVQGATIDIVEVDGGGYAVVDSADNQVALGEPTLTQSAAPSAVYIIDQVLTAPEAMAPGGDTEGGDDGTGGDDSGTGGGAEGSTYAALQADPDLSQIAALAAPRQQALEADDAGNRAQVLFAPTNDAIDPEVTSVLAYTYTGRGTGEGELAAGEYQGFRGVDGTETGRTLTFNVAGSSDGGDLTINGGPAEFIETSSGAALYVFGPAPAQ